jgi:hypothetical protein
MKFQDRLTLSLPPDLHEQIKRAAKADGRKTAAYIRWVLMRWMQGERPDVK